MIKSDALEVVIEEGRTRVEKIMTTIVMTLNCSRAIQEADDLMAEKEIEHILVTKGTSLSPLSLTMFFL